MSHSPLRIVVAGANGFIGKAHVQDILHEEDAELAALIDNDPSIALAAKECGVPSFSDLEGFLSAHKAGDTKADAVILATPTHTHIPMAECLVGTGLTVLIEKPLAPTGDEGRRFLEICKADTKGTYMVGHHRRHNCYVRAIKDVLDKKELGRIVAVNGVWAQRKSEQYFSIPWHQQVGAGGVLLTNAIHEMDMLQYWLGNIEEVHAIEGPKERPYPVDSTVQVTMKFASSVIGSFLFTDVATSHLSWEAGTGDVEVFPATGEDFLTIFGTEGSISVPSLTRYHYGNRPQAEQNWNYPLDKDTRAQEWVDNKTSFSHQLKHFIATARGEVAPNCSVEDGLRAVFVIEAVHESLRNGKAALVRKV